MNKDKKRLDYFQLNHAIEAFSAENPKFTSYHIALLWHILQTSNKLNWATTFTLHSERAQHLAGFVNSKTYNKTLNSLEEFGFIEFIERSTNQYTQNIIKICWDKFAKALLKQRTSKASATPNQVPSNASAPPYIKDIKEEIKDNKEFINHKETDSLEKEKLLFAYGEKIEKTLSFFGFTNEPEKTKLLLETLHKLSRQPENIQKFFTQTEAYFEYKGLTTEKKHSFLRFLGQNEPNGILNGGWNSENWIFKLNELKKQNKVLQLTDADYENDKL